MDLFRYVRGTGPLLVSMPHDGSAIPAEIAAGMSDAGRASPDTDWHVGRLYDFLVGAETSVLAANYSRYVVDLNRPADGAALYPGQDETGLCPRSTFDRQAIYQAGAEPDPHSIQLRIEQYWQPYHRQLQSALEQIRDRHGYALLWEAHSIRSVTPRFFSGRLPDFNLGTAAGLSCPAAVLDALKSLIVADGHFSVVCNARFKGGYITRHYGAPQQKIYAVQLELAQSTYLQEDGSNAYQPRLAAPVRCLLEQLLERFQSEILAS